MATATNSQIQFLADQRPALADGIYEITVTQVVTGALIPKETFQPAPLQFAVSGPRFSLNASDFLEIFPPQGSQGDYFEVLPHLILDRATLPWERTSNEAAKPGPPWLALLVFLPGEIPALQNITVGDLKKRPVAGVHATPFVAKPGDPPDATPVTVIRVPWGVLKNVLPSAADLPYLAHARRTGAEEPHAVVIANRLPTEGKQILVHLVSLEGLYNGGSFFVPDGSNDTDGVELISLYSWDFFCQKDSAGHFRDLLSKVQPNPFRMPPLAGINPIANSCTQAGFIPLIHRFRQGDTSVSWYHGPLIPLDGGANVHYNTAAAGAAVNLPARNGDELLLYYQDQGMLDVSYAAAWELGRLLMLQNSRISTALFRWKRERALEAAANGATRQAATAHLAQLTPSDPAKAAELDRERQQSWKEIQDWFGTQLALLEGVPFNYLAPDEQYLPNECLRFFAVDPIWIQCLWDGAFSIGRSSADDLDRDRAVLAGTDAQFKMSNRPPMAGLMLRSAAVAGFPSMLMDAYFQSPVDSSPPASVGLRIPLLRQEQLAPNVSIALFDTTGHPTLAAVDFHLPPLAMHFGVSITADGEHFTKNQIAPQSFRSDAKLRVIALKSLADALKAPAQVFAKDMIEGVPVIRFVLSPGGAS